ncbi:MAG: 50S ribosomal protein L35 [Candidatus Portnoybacteria bacterium CG10_big_fil_rev_8_21_14_0_10_44_7]|uniref:Large ribosomal subunit protein bL35 n=1 Tax=Candidatus Portnoybacteria bacterium CG10_big_fil_rev_8_21_14_0_10_44_7 TaxID=1974816 RepID=A0A2M8KJC4_9BACT|nr:MAG: 50S ribosomal protein L35 [Candidatus Portnoybacteria bacterium CG10_big_fil_rev_8_21_14_0_10_44_7]
MSKAKTRKSILKRFKITGRKKLLHRTPGQNHFNAKESGKITRRKKEESELQNRDEKTLKKQLPNL